MKENDIMVYNEIMKALRNGLNKEDAYKILDEALDDYNAELAEDSKFNAQREAMTDIIKSFKDYVLKFVEEDSSDEKIKEITESFDSINVDDFIDIFDKLYHANFKMTRMKPTELFKFFF